MKKAKILVLIILLISLFSCEGKKGGQAASLKEYKGKAPKYVFLFIGDGLGFPQTQSTELFLSTQKGEKVKLSYSSFPAQGITTTHAKDRYITGSAAAATAMACGEKTSIGTVAMDADKSRELKTIAEYAKEAGKKVGIISSVSIDHATPACFYAHQSSRNHYYEIALQMADSGFDYFGGGGAKGNKESKRKDKDGNLRQDIVDVMKEAGYKVAQTQNDLENCKAGDKVFAFNHTLDSDAALYFDMDSRQEDISLARFTREGIRLLDNEKGFFMMIEGGKIDWACHANDAYAAITDVLAFDKAVQEALAFYEKHPRETLIVLSGDHECGGMTIGFAGTGYETYFGLLAEQKASYIEMDKKIAALKEEGRLNWDSLLVLLKEVYALGKGELVLTDYEKRLLKKALAAYGEVNQLDEQEMTVLFGGYNPLTVTATHILNQKAGIGWTSFKHTGVAIGTYAKGSGAELFNGYYDNTDIFHKIMAIARYESKVAVSAF